MFWFNVFALGYFMLIMFMVVVTSLDFSKNPQNGEDVGVEFDSVELVDTGVEYIDADGELQKKRVALATMVGIPECQVMSGRHVIAPSELDLAAYMISRNVRGFTDGFAGRRKLPSEHRSFEKLNLPTLDARTPDKYFETTRSGDFIPLPYREPIGVTTNEIMM